MVQIRNFAQAAFAFGNFRPPRLPASDLHIDSEGGRFTTESLLRYQPQPRDHSLIADVPVKSARLRCLFGMTRVLGSGRDDEFWSLPSAILWTCVGNPRDTPRAIMTCATCQSSSWGAFCSETAPIANAHCQAFSSRSWDRRRLRRGRAASEDRDSNPRGPLDQTAPRLPRWPVRYNPPASACQPRQTNASSGSPRDNRIRNRSRPCRKQQLHPAPCRCR